jgi:hypothetical protein
VRLIPAVVALSLLGCPEPFQRYVTDGEGKTWRIVKCGRHTECMQHSSELCPTGYVERPGGEPKEMLIRCTGDSVRQQTELKDWQ